MVAIAFEFTGDHAKGMDVLGRCAERYDVKYPLLLGGTNDKTAAAKRLPDLSAVAAYPTTLFVRAMAPWPRSTGGSPGRPRATPSRR